MIAFAEAGYGFLKGGFPYSQGAAALPGFAIERVRLLEPLPMQEGFRFISDWLARLGRPRIALCAAELRSPRPFSFAGFGEFNKDYRAVLEEWNIVRDGLNPVARSNVAPVSDPPSEPCFYAFSYAVPSPQTNTFIVAGSGEWPEGGRFPDDIVARGDVSAAGIRQKARFVIGKMKSRMQGLGVTTARVAQVYTAHDFHPVIGDIHALAPAASVTWQWCRPPIEGLDFEMDLRSVSAERLPA
jgi:hypothetical protein